MDRPVAAAGAVVARYLAAVLGSGGMLLSTALLLLPTSRAARCVAQWPHALAEGAWGYGIAAMSLLLLLWAHDSRRRARFSGVDYTTCGLLIVGGLLLIPLALLVTATDADGVVRRAECGLNTWSAFGVVLTSFFPVLNGLLVVVFARISALPLWMRLVSPAVVLAVLWWLNAGLIDHFSAADVSIPSKRYARD